MLVWIDVETTGLEDPADGLLLEVALVVTDDALNDTGWSWSQVIGHYHRWLLEAMPAGSWARQQHTKSGLFDESRRLFPGADVRTSEKGILNWLAGIGLEPGQSPMCGSTVGFDRAWLKVHMPALEAWFHYRHIDVTTVSELAQRWSGLERPGGDKPHRALDDIRMSIDALRHWRSIGFVGLAR